MEAIESMINPSSKEYKENFSHYEALVKDMKGKIAIAMKGGGDEAVKLHKSRKKMLARERIDALLDPETPFMEFNTLAAHDMYDNKAPAAGIVTGIGIIHGREVVIVANDATVTGGTYYPITVKKHLRSTRAGRSSRCRTKCSLTVSISDGFSTTRQRCRLWKSRKSRWSWGHVRPGVRTSPRCLMKPSS
jgi:3-methylcrotonyl-CoA carboxylase beta subunit